MDYYSDTESIISGFNDKDNLFISVKLSATEDDYDDVFVDDISTYCDPSIHSPNNDPHGDNDSVVTVTNYNYNDFEQLQQRSLKLASDVTKNRLTKLLIARYKLNVIKLINVKKYIRSIDIQGSNNKTQTEDYLKPSETLSQFLRINYKLVNLSSSSELSFVDSDFKYSLHKKDNDELNLKCEILNHFYSELDTMMNEDESNGITELEHNDKIMKLIDWFSKLLKSYNFDRTISSNSSSKITKRTSQNQLKSISIGSEQNKYPNGPLPNVTPSLKNKPKPATKEKERKKFSLFRQSSSSPTNSPKKSKRNYQPPSTAISTKQSQHSTTTSIKEAEKEDLHRYKQEEVMRYDKTLDDLYKLVQRLTLTSTSPKKQQLSCNSSFSNTSSNSSMQPFLTAERLSKLVAFAMDNDEEINISDSKSINDGKSNEYTQSCKVRSKVDATEFQFSASVHSSKGLTPTQRSTSLKRSVPSNTDKNFDQRQPASPTSSSSSFTTASLQQEQDDYNSVNTSTSKEATVQAINTSDGLEKAILIFVNLSLMPFICVDYQRFLDEYLAEVDKLIANLLI